MEKETTKNHLTYSEGLVAEVAVGTSFYLDSLESKRASPFKKKVLLLLLFTYFYILPCNLDYSTPYSVLWKPHDDAGRQVGEPQAAKFTKTDTIVQFLLVYEVQEGLAYTLRSAGDGIFTGQNFVVSLCMYLHTIKSTQKREEWSGLRISFTHGTTLVTVRDGMIGGSGARARVRAFGVWSYNTEYSTYCIIQFSIVCKYFGSMWLLRDALRSKLGSDHHPTMFLRHLWSPSLHVPILGQFQHHLVRSTIEWVGPVSRLNSACNLIVRADRGSWSL